MASLESLVKVNERLVTPGFEIGDRKLQMAIGEVAYLKSNPVELPMEPFLIKPPMTAPVLSFRLKGAFFARLNFLPDHSGPHHQSRYYRYIPSEKIGQFF